jgi:predicted methyltransferase/acyl carrier protein
MKAQETEDSATLYTLLSRISGTPAEKIDPDMSLFGRGLGLDSVSGTVLMAALDEEYGITLDDIDLHMDALNSVGSLKSLVSSFHKPAPTESKSALWGRLLEGVAAAARLREGRAGVERVLGCVLNQPGLTSRALAAQCSLPTPTVSALRKEMAKADLLISDSPGARLTTFGAQVAIGLALSLAMPEHGDGAYGRFRNNTLFATLVEKLSVLLASRPDADTSLDQAKGLPETAAARALLALEYGAVAGRRIAFVGDDDFTSIGVAVLGKMLSEQGALEPEQVTVLDIDERILGVIARLASENRLPIITVQHDMRNPVPSGLAGLHDAFYTDPPYTVVGASLFTGRGIELCKTNGYLAFFSFANKGPGEMLAVQRALGSMGMLIREVLPGFNRYEGASLWGNQSQMLVCEGATQERDEVAVYSGPLYTADFRAPRNSDK